MIHDQQSDDCPGLLDTIRFNGKSIISSTATHTIIFCSIMCHNNIIYPSNEEKIITRVIAKANVIAVS